MSANPVKVNKDNATATKPLSKAALAMMQKSESNYHGTAEQREADLESTAVLDKERERAKGGKGAKLLPMELIDPSPFQPRQRGSAGFSDNEIASLAEAIAKQGFGLLNAIIVRPSTRAEGRFELIAGERRVRAFRLLNRAEIPAIVKEMDDQDAAAAALVDNEERVQLTQYEIAHSFKRYEECFPGTPAAEIARRFHQDIRLVYRCEYFWKLPSEVLDLLDKNPALLQASYAEKFSLLCDKHPQGETFVIEALKQVNDGLNDSDPEKEKFTLSHAKKQVERQIKGVERKPPAPKVSLFVDGVDKPVASMTRSKRNITLSLDRIVDPARFEKWLQENLKGALLELAYEKQGT
ncbi:ParB/RepB/Spo0J family partition protein [Paraburkholderia sp. UCT31]|uniref:ParB/RepB/Spo0J family partition protein n=1 Tax=Paraburkholderia sp. UCT31 TaxID=2615209 RepID=UPI0016555694|nr:ParB/RepB/Spo0J family partition protein [Paraburkholderia sp. UCT31]MBC8737253.1 ParB/RepB/Spo0J family partition protein [Paraburkholderia sp. UCT31]